MTSKVLATDFFTDDVNNQLKRIMKVLDINESDYNLVYKPDNSNKRPTALTDESDMSRFLV
jgi:hypothetical protein